MRVGLFQTESACVQVVRDHQYGLELRALRYWGVDAALRAEAMERELLVTEGYPVGSYPVEPALLGIEAQDWEEALVALDFNQANGARLALELIDRQRIFEKDGIAIAYMVVMSDWGTTIYLGAVTSTENPASKNYLWRFLRVNP